MNLIKVLARNLNKISSPVKPTARPGRGVFFARKALQGSFNLADSLLANKKMGVNMYWKRYGTFCLVIILALFVVGCSNRKMECRKEIREHYFVLSDRDMEMTVQIQTNEVEIELLQSRIKRLEQRKPVTHK